jgi:hypothetical protein
VANEMEQKALQEKLAALEKIVDGALGNAD